MHFAQHLLLLRDLLVLREDLPHKVLALCSGGVERNGFDVFRGRYFLVSVVVLIVVVSFLPVFLLEAQEGRMFRPLAWTKTAAVGFSSLLAITLVPALMPLFIRGRLRPESQNPIVLAKK